MDITIIENEIHNIKNDLTELRSRYFDTINELNNLEYSSYNLSNFKSFLDTKLETKLSKEDFDSFSNALEMIQLQNTVNFYYLDNKEKYDRHFNLCELEEYLNEYYNDNVTVRVDPIQSISYIHFFFRDRGSFTFRYNEIIDIFIVTTKPNIEGKVEYNYHLNTKHFFEFMKVKMFEKGLNI